ncbi:MAG: hypothetical protein WCG52_06430 [bacterium]
MTPSLQDNHRRLTFCSTVCLRLQPWATSEREDRLSVIPKSFQAKAQTFSKIFYRLNDPIGEAFRVLENIPE